MNHNGDGKRLEVKRIGGCGGKKVNKGKRDKTDLRSITQQSNSPKKDKQNGYLHEFERGCWGTPTRGSHRRGRDSQ